MALRTGTQRARPSSERKRADIRSVGWRSAALPVPHTGRVRRHRRDQEQQRRLDAYVTGASDQERGAVVLALFGHAVIYLLLSAAEATWVGATAVRVWRRGKRA